MIQRTSRRRSRSATGAIVVCVAVVLAGCAPSEGGPLRGPRSALGVVEVCMPVGPDQSAYFGEVLQNTGKNPATIVGVEIGDSAPAGTEVFVDAEAGALDQLAGAFAWPSDDQGFGYEGDLIARIVPAVGAQIPAGATVNLVVRMPAPAGDADNISDHLALTYTAGGDDYVEVVSVTHRARAGESCE